MNYGELLSRSWRIVWKNKFMIVLGFLAALGGGANFGNSNYTADGSEFQGFPMTDLPFAPPTPAQMSAAMAAIGAVAASVLCFAVIVGIALWLLRLTAEGGLIDAASQLDAGAEVTFRGAMSTGWKYVWRMVGLGLLLFGVIIGAFLIVGLIFSIGIGGSIAGATASSGDVQGLFAALGGTLFFLLCCVICGIFLLAIALSIVYTFAQRAIVLEDLGVLDSVRRGWEVIRANLSEVIILLILFLFLYLAVGAITWAVAIPLGAIAFGPGAWRLFSGEALSTLDVILMVVGGLAMVFIIAAIRSFYVAFSSSAYTLAFQEFTGKKLPPEDLIPEKLPPEA